MYRMKNDCQRPRLQHCCQTLNRCCQPLLSYSLIFIAFAAIIIVLWVWNAEHQTVPDGGLESWSPTMSPSTWSPTAVMT
jgi:hypothetical protein